MENIYRFTPEHYSSALINTVSSIKPIDEIELVTITATISWIASGSPVLRQHSPAKHLAVYNVLYDDDNNLLLLMNHRKSGLMLPSGGHMEANELPLDTAFRELREELGVFAAPLLQTQDIPFFIGENEIEANHTDVDLWYLMKGSSHDTFTGEDFAKEFDGYGWHTPEEILEMPLNMMDQHMHRFVYKLLGTIDDATLDT